MKKHKKIGDIDDYIKANRKASRTEEIAAHGKLISMRTIVFKSKKKYDRNKEKKAGLKDLPFFMFLFQREATYYKNKTK